MKQEITLTHVTVDEITGAIEVGHNWNGYAGASVFPDAASLLGDSEDIITSHVEAARWLRYYLLNLGHTVETMVNAVGKTLVVDVKPAVQQVIALVDPQS